MRSAVTFTPSAARSLYSGVAYLGGKHLALVVCDIFVGALSAWASVAEHGLKTGTLLLLLLLLLLLPLLLRLLLLLLLLLLLGRTIRRLRRYLSRQLCRRGNCLRSKMIRLKSPFWRCCLEIVGESVLGAWEEVR